LDKVLTVLRSLSLTSGLVVTTAAVLLAAQPVRSQIEVLEMAPSLTPFSTPGLGSGGSSLTPLTRPPQAGIGAGTVMTAPVDTGPKVNRKDWVAERQASRTTPILVMAGHADSQNMAGSGTSGSAVGTAGARPMQPGISDELYWNLLTAQTIVRIGQQHGLNIQFYDPPSRTIPDAHDPRTTWSVGAAFKRSGGYALEIHYDAYGPAGVGSGLVPGFAGGIESIDEALATEFGAFPAHFRGLGAPKLGVSLLEVGKLEGNLEQALRNPATRQQTLETIALRVVTAMEQGMGINPGFSTPPTMANTNATQPGSQPIIRSIFTNQ
jgi:hypothetical protein